MSAKRDADEVLSEADARNAIDQIKWRKVDMGDAPPMRVREVPLGLWLDAGLLFPTAGEPKEEEG